MAIDAHSTTAPARPLLPLAAGRPAPTRDTRGRVLKPVHVEQVFGQLAQKPELPPEPLLAPADAARALYLRRQLEAAAEHGAHLLAALSLPRLVTPDFVSFDRSAIGEAVDRVISALDALDEDSEAEDGDDAEHDTADAEHSLGWPAERSQACLGHCTDDAEDDELGDERPREPSAWIVGPSRQEVAHG